jgi:hypothetical protein
MTADVEVPWDLFYTKFSTQPAAIVVLKGLFGHLELTFLIGFLEKFEALSTIDRTAVPIESVLLNGAEVGGMRHHGILNVE